MTSHREYWDQLRSLERGIGARFGVDFRMSSQETRAVLAVVGAALAVIIKALVDKGVITDQDLTDGWTVAATDTWDPEPATNDPNPPPI